MSVATASCGDVARERTRSPVFLVIESLEASPGGASGGTPGSFLHSDVQTLVTSPAPCTATQPCPTIYSDSGTATFRLSLKDLGSAAAPASPSATTT